MTPSGESEGCHHIRSFGHHRFHFNCADVVWKTAVLWSLTTKMCHKKHSWRHCGSWREPFHYPQESHHIIVFFFVLLDMSGGISKEGILAVPIDSMMLDRRVADGQLRSVSKLFTSEKMKGSSLERPTISTLQMCVAGRFRPSTFCKVSLHTHIHTVWNQTWSPTRNTMRLDGIHDSPPIQITHPRPESPWYDHWVAESANPDSRVRWPAVIKQSQLGVGDGRKLKQRAQTKIGIQEGMNKPD